MGFAILTTIAQLRQRTREARTHATVKLRAHTNINIVTPARGVLSRLSESRFSALRNPEKCPRGVHGDPRRPPRAPEGPSFEPQALQRAQICA